MKFSSPTAHNLSAFISFSSARFEDHSAEQLFDAIKASGVRVPYEWHKVPITEKPTRYFQTILSEIDKADVLIADVTLRSTGVGQHLSFAYQKRKPLILLIEKTEANPEYSYFITSLPKRSFHQVVFSNFEDLTMQLQKLLPQIKVKEKLQKFNFIATQEIKQVLLSEAEKLKLSSSELLRSIVEEWIDTNVKSPHS